MNQQASEARQYSSLIEKVKATRPEYLADLEWLDEQRQQQAFITIAEYRKSVLGEKAAQIKFNEDYE